MRAVAVREEEDEGAGEMAGADMRAGAGAGVVLARDGCAPA